MLRAWQDELQRATAPHAHEVLDAFVEVVVHSTGPGGFWRKTAPRVWFGCNFEPLRPVCQRLAGDRADFERWDRIAQHLARLPLGAADGYLDAQLQNLLAYLDTYAPVAPTPTGVEATGYYRQRLAPDLAR
jgi:hypothetical protein